MFNRRRFLAGLPVALFSSCQSTPRLTVGSKDSVESRLISEIASILLQRKLSARLERNFGITGSTVAYTTLQGGGIDLYPEYSRIAYKVLLKTVEQADLGLMLDVMKRELDVNAQASALPFLGFQNLHTAVVMADNPMFFAVNTLSQAAESKTGWRLGCTSDFAQSAEGYVELKQRYRMMESAGTRLEPVNQLYFGLRDRRIDILITGSTDPRLKDSRYKALTDDLNAFSPNYCCLFYRKDAGLKYPSILPVLTSLSGKLDTVTMQALNGEVEVNKRGFEEVAVEWLTREKLL